MKAQDFDKIENYIKKNYNETNRALHTMTTRYAHTVM